MLKFIKNPAMIGAAFALSVAGFSSLSAKSGAKPNVRHDMTQCKGAKPAVLVTLQNVRTDTGMVRVQLYPATKAAWLKKDAWINRIELPARKGVMKVCMPVPKAGTYGIAVLHDTNNNGKTDFSKDGGGASNNPAIDVMNLGKPPVEKVAFPVGNGVKPMSIAIKYM